MSKLQRRPKRSLQRAGRGGLLAATLCLLAPAVLAQAVTPATPATSAPLADDPQAIRVLLSPALETTLVTQMAGRIARLPVELGQRIAKGNTAVAFDCSETQARLQMAQAEAKAAEQTLSARERLQQLQAAGAVEVALAAAEAEKARAAVALNRAQLAQCTVQAPFAGRVVKLYVKPFQAVNAGAPLLEIVSDGPLKLRLNVPSRWLAQIKVGTNFDVTINETGRTYPAVVRLINARVDAVAQSIELEARLQKNETDLLAGMSGIARFPGLH